MKKLSLVCFACTLLVSMVAAAQSTKQDDPATQDTAKTKAPEKQAEKPVKGTMTVTGCLRKGDETGEFSIAGEDGKLWGLRSSMIKLQDHLGHKVTVVGTASGESKAEAKMEKKDGDAVNAGQKQEYRDLSVTSLKMITDSCTK